MTEKELNAVLEQHKHWLREDCDDWSIMQADLRGADLHAANLHNADLRGAIMREADLRRADLTDADLSNADLSGADLSNADLRRANLLCTNLDKVDFTGANMHYAKNIPPLPMACPSEGSFIAWKRAGGFILKLKVPAKARRSSATTRKCRCDKAKVLTIEKIDGTPAGVDFVASDYDKSFIYRIGETACVKNFDADRWTQCTSGIHFFIDRLDAVKYAD